jgi:peptidoglycan/xylan/chitin deacetylase (PgdA/CDA1 family)
MISTLKKFVRRKTPGAVVMMYHRIVDHRQDPWDLCVSPANFSDQLQKLSNQFDIIPMYRLAERLQLKEPLKNLLAITFDDGYMDNYQTGKPILEKYKMPATFYLTTKFKTGGKYWWDELEQLILNTPVLPEAATINLHGKVITLLLGDSKILNESVTRQNAAWRYGKPLSNSRLKLYYECWDTIKRMNIDDQKIALQEIKNWAGISVVSTPPLMSEQQIKALASSNLFEIGGHTINHPALGTLSSHQQHEEIEGCKKGLENIVPQTMMGLAYPYGHYNDQTPVLTKNCGFKYAVTTEEKMVTGRDSIYEIPRFQAKNMDGDSLMGEIKQWKKNLSNE